MSAWNEAVPLLVCEALQVGHQANVLFEPMTMRLNAGEFWIIVGENGAGKTTLLRTLLGLHRPTSGRMEWSEGARVGYVPQRASLDSTIPARVIDVITQGVERRWSFLRPSWRSAHRARITSAMERTRTQELAHKKYAQLSEGQKQRVLIARALTAHPEVLLLDEPTSAMDAQAEGSILELLNDFRHREGMTLVMISHHIEAVAPLVTDVMLLPSGHKGHVLMGTPHAVAHDPLCPHSISHALTCRMDEGQEGCHGG